MAPCQANVVMFRETQNWPDDGTAEVGMDPAEGKEGWKGSDCSEKEELEPSEMESKKQEMDTGRSWKYSLSFDVLATHLGC